MKLLYISISLLFLLSCTKKVGNTKKDNKKTLAPETTSEVCNYSGTSKITYSNSIHDILFKNCASCHSRPGSGGIDLDTYKSCADEANSGDLMQVIQNTDPNSVMMPPPPQKHLDSCEIKALNLWIKQGCLLN